MKRIATSLLIVFCFSIAEGQVRQLWNQTYSSKINWQQVSSYGHFIVGGSQALMGVDPLTGEQLWAAPEFANVPMEAVQQMGGSPLLSVNIGTDIALLDPFSGKKKFDSNEAGIVEIIDQFILYNANGILISGRNSDLEETIVMASLETGEVAWSIREDYGRVVAASEVSANEVLIVTLFYNYKINASTGEILWKNDIEAGANAQIEELGALGALVKDMATTAANQMDINVAFYQHPSRDLFIIASEQEGSASSSSGFSTSSTSSSSPQYHVTYLGFKLSSGDRVWPADIEVNGKLGALHFTDKGFISLPNNGGSTKINLYDYESAQGMWGKKGKGIKLKGGIYDYVPAGDNLLLVTGSGERNFISYLDISQGMLTFDKPTKIDGRLTFSEQISKGLLFITSEEVNILDPSTGGLLLADPIRIGGGLTQDANTLYAYDSKQRAIRVLDKASGKVSVFSPEIRFDGKEVPAYLELRAGSLLLSSEQNMLMLDNFGEISYTKYLEAPREPGIIRALRYAQAIHSAYVGVLSYSASAQLDAISHENAENEAVSVIADGLGQAYGEIGDVYSDFAKKSFQMANARFKATSEGDNYLVILANKGDHNALVQVNKDSGEEEGQIDLGNDREPNYAMDGVLGYVFYQTGPNSITGYKL